MIATPIGNLDDITLRAMKTLEDIDALACEDTRITRKIFSRYNITRPDLVFSYHDYNEDRAGNRILELLRDDKNVGLCTNAGYPGISDPGYRIISDSLREGFEVEVIPGASAITLALLSSGLPSSSYTFKGFLPRKRGQRKTSLFAEKDSPHTLVAFESPNRLPAMLQDAYDVLGDRLAAVCIELTKRYEKTYRGFLSVLIDDFIEVKVKGEVTVVISGNHPKFIKNVSSAE